MQGHSAANLVPVAAANRIGREDVLPTKENGGQKSSLTFYGSSFITDNTGAKIEELGREEEGIISAEFDLDEYSSARLEWGLFRDRRPDRYTDITKK
jgi:N-carbamoylputrescine amidase